MSGDMITVFIIVIATIALLIIDKIRIDVVALLCLLALAWTGILDPAEALSGFSSNAVLAMLSVMIIGRGIAKTGIMDRFANLVFKAAGNNQPGTVALVSSAVGLLSGFIQNIGAVVIFLPSIMSLSKRIKVSASRLIMPIGFAAILGGTLTMVGSGPLIMVNDLLKTAALEPYGIFAVTPIGLCLLVGGILFFLLAGKYVLPRRPLANDEDWLQKILVDTWKLPESIYHYRIPENSPLAGMTLEDSGIWTKYHIHVLAISRKSSLEYAPWRNSIFTSGHTIALLGNEENVSRFAADYLLLSKDKPGRLKSINDPESAGFAEIIIPPRSAVAGKSLRAFGFRRHYGIEPVVLLHSGSKIEGDFSDVTINPGDTLIVHGTWQNISQLKKSNELAVITPVPADSKNPTKTLPAIACFVLAIGLTFAGFPLSISLLTGAIAMVVTRVIEIEEAYQAVDWKVVFFLAGLIPLSIAMEKTGSALYLASAVMDVIQGSHLVLTVLTVAIIATIFSLFMSNVAATVVLAPLVINMAQIGGYDPRGMVLLVAVSAANSFLLPTHQVNVMLKTRGGYSNLDYLKAGGGMTIIFLTIVVGVFYLIYF
jgi:di/tricarboxylate transporter